MKSTHYGFLLSTAWRFCDRKRWRFFLIYGLFLCANLLAMVEPLILGWAVNTIQKGGPDMLWHLAYLLLSMIVLEVAFWAFHGPGRVIERELSFDVAKNYRQKLFTGICHLPLKWHHDHHSGSLISRGKKGSDAILEFTGNQFMYIENFCQFLLIGAVFFWFIPKYAFLAVLTSALLFAIIYRFDKNYAKSLKQVNEKEHHMDAGFIDFIGNAVTLITLRVQKLAQKEYFKRIRAIRIPFCHHIRVNEWKWFLTSVGSAVIFIIVLLPYAYEMHLSENEILLGTFVALFQYTKRYTSIFFGFAYKYERLVHHRTSLEALEKIWNAIEAHPITTTKLDKKSWHQVDISNLFFRHEKDTKAHDLHNINLSLKKGQRIALIGESGSGKSTLMRVMRGLYIPSQIQVAFDDKESPEAYQWLINHTTLIPQDPEIFESTIRFNVTLGVSVNQQTFDQAIKLARFDKVLARLPKGDQTDIRERGVNLSGGEKQRLALARGILAAEHSDIILLDEPTSSVDMKNEEAILKALFKTYPDKCFVASVHRLHLLPLFDTIYEMKAGKISPKK